MSNELMNKEFEKDSLIIKEQADLFVELVAPYMAINDDNVKDYLEDNTLDKLKEFRFYRLGSCTTDNIDELDNYMQEKMNKLYTAIHSLNVPVIYGIISKNGRTNLVLGVEDKENQEIIGSVLHGLMTGIDIEEPGISAEDFSVQDGKGGIISSVPAVKIGDEKQNFDISVLMRSLNGYDYSVLFTSKPYTLDNVQDIFGKIVKIRDNCFAVSKRNVSTQKNESTTTSRSESQSPATWNAIIRSWSSKSKKNNGGKTVSDTTTETSAESEAVSLDIQNGFALELMEYCDKALERIKQGQNLGLWGTAISYHAENEIASNIIKACLCGELSKSTSDILPLKTFKYDGGVAIPKLGSESNKLLAPITSYELGMISTLPYEAVPDFELKQGKQYPMVSSSAENGVAIGKISDGQRPIDKMVFELSEKDLNKHTFVCGITGSGKTTTVKRILSNCEKPFMVIESAKKEYRNLDKKPQVYTLGKPEINCIQFNPFYVQCGINLQTHIDYLKDLFNASFSFYGPMPYILERCLHNVYKKKGWNLTLGYHPLLINMENKSEMFSSEYMGKKYSLKAHKQLFPTMMDLKKEVKRYIEQEMQYDGEVGGNIKTAILTRLESLCIGSKGYMFNTTECINMEDILKNNVVFELEGLADDSDKAFCVGLLVIFINEYRQVDKEKNCNKDVELQHLLVIEEAHRLLKNIETERSSENMGNPKGKAVEHFTNMIAEMRSYGQGVIIAEQIPSKLAPDVIKNSSNKIIQRVVSADDQRLVANTVGMKQEDAVLLGSLRTGMGLCHKEGMSLPVYVSIDNVDDKTVNDGDIQKPDVVYDNINYYIVKEATSDIIDTVGLKILNSILCNSESDVSESLKYAKKLMSNELLKNSASLIKCNNEDKINGKIIAENIMTYLVNGVYCMKKIADDNFFENLEKLCINSLPEDATKVKNSLKAAYKCECRNYGINVISELIKRDLRNNVNIRSSIEQYFYVVDDELLSEITKKIEEGSQK